MSTRRARIKAVASLPVRRKNVDSITADTKPKQNEPKESTEKLTQSPKTPRTYVSKKSEEKQISPPLQAPISQEPYANIDVEKSISNKVESALISKTQTSEEALFVVPNDTIQRNNTLPRTPKLSEKVSVITLTPFLKTHSSKVSPIRRNSPIVKNVASPLTLSPRNLILRTEVTTEENISPEVTKLLTTDIDTTEHTVLPLPAANDTAVTSALNIEDQKNIDKDYNPPSIPESITDETVMDGIVPLQSIQTVPKPIALLKNEIISENAEVLFDPIVPLPSPSKVRPKLRPVPRLNTIRRNSVQGSASESEDESRRSMLGGGASTPAPARQRQDSHTSHSTLYTAPNKEINRVRNDSMCSSVSQAAVQPLHVASPLKEKNVTKCRRPDASRRLAAMRRHRAEAVQREKLTMYDLIFYNPTTNPILPEKEVEKDLAEDKKSIEGEDVDDPSSESEAAPVPQIKIGPNGEIILDQQSLVIKQTQSERKLASGVIRETYRPLGTGGRYTRSTRTAEWSAVETVRFYRALAAAGTDFSLMAPLFPDRTRRDLKLKFKKEEKVNGAQVDKALRSATTWDVFNLQKEFTDEREEALRKAAQDKERLELQQREERERIKQNKLSRIRHSKAAKAIQSTSQQPVERPPGDATTADQVIKRAIEKKEQNRKKKTVKQLHTTPVYGTLPQPIRIHTPQSTPIAEMPSMSRADPKVTPGHFNPISVVPSNLETGSLVVLTVDDPKNPSKKMLQTYVAQAGGKIIPIALPPALLNSVVGYMKKGTPKSTISTNSSPHISSPSSVMSHDSRDSRTSVTPGVIQINPSPVKRQRLSSYTITQLL